MGDGLARREIGGTPQAGRFHRCYATDNSTGSTVCGIHGSTVCWSASPMMRW